MTRLPLIDGDTRRKYVFLEVNIALLEILKESRFIRKTSGRDTQEKAYVNEPAAVFCGSIEDVLTSIDVVRNAKEREESSLETIS